jgi:hypothetical protein
MVAETSSAAKAKRVRRDTTNSISEPTTSTPDNPFIFHTGNVRLKAKHLITDELIIGTVSSDALVFASHMWKKFLFPPWEEEGEAASLMQKVIDCSEDDPVALPILLNIAHLQFRSISATLPYVELYNVAILCDQYD